jgi:hypothetical protein
LIMVGAFVSCNGLLGGIMRRFAADISTLQRVAE